MHSIPLTDSNLASLNFSAAAMSIWGTRFSGQASTQRPHLMQGPSGTRSIGSSLNARRADEVFVTGTEVSNRLSPIMVPPEISFFGLVVNPPAASSTSE